MSFLSTPSARRATEWLGPRFFDDAISIHALREEGDCASSGRACAAVLISIHALREEGDPAHAEDTANMMYFYPRPPRGGRLAGAIPKGQDRDISIHALREEGDWDDVIFVTMTYDISIHALREEGDTTNTNEATLYAIFLSTPSARRATSSTSITSSVQTISIHALREEGDGRNNAGCI